MCNIVIFQKWYKLSCVKYTIKNQWVGRNLFALFWMVDFSNILMKKVKTLSVMKNIDV